MQRKARELGIFSLSPTWVSSELVAFSARPFLFLSKIDSRGETEFAEQSHTSPKKTTVSQELSVLLLFSTTYACLSDNSRPRTQPSAETETRLASTEFETQLSANFEEQQGQVFKS